MTEHPVRWGLGLLSLGIALHILYEGLKAAEIGKIGAPSDIGGGVIPLVGYIAAAAGVALLIGAWLDCRSRKR